LTNKRAFFENMRAPNENKMAFCACLHRIRVGGRAMEGEGVCVK